MSEKRKQAGGALYLMVFGGAIFIVAVIGGGAFPAQVFGALLFGAGLLSWKSL